MFEYFSKRATEEDILVLRHLTYLNRLTIVYRFRIAIMKQQLCDRPIHYVINYTRSVACLTHKQDVVSSDNSSEKSM